MPYPPSYYQPPTNFWSPTYTPPIYTPPPVFLNNNSNPNSINRDTIYTGGYLIPKHNNSAFHINNTFNYIFDVSLDTTVGNIPFLQDMRIKVEKACAPLDNSGVNFGKLGDHMSKLGEALKLINWGIEKLSDPVRFLPFTKPIATGLQLFGGLFQAVDAVCKWVNPYPHRPRGQGDFEYSSDPTIAGIQHALVERMNSSEELGATAQASTPPASDSNIKNNFYIATLSDENRIHALTNGFVSAWMQAAIADNYLIKIYNGENTPETDAVFDVKAMEKARNLIPNFSTIDEEILNMYCAKSVALVANKTISEYLIQAVAKTPQQLEADIQEKFTLVKKPVNGWIDNPVYNVINENNDIGLSVALFHAIDNNYDGVSYWISGNDNNYFSIHSDGTLTLNSSLDYENKNHASSYQIIVYALDKAENGGVLRDTSVISQQFVLSLTNDTNEYDIHFNSYNSLASLHISENNNLGIALASYSAVDNLNGNISYYLNGKNKFSFAIDAQGYLIFNEVADYERRINYEVTVIAVGIDNNNQHQQISKLISLYIDDIVNDAGGRTGGALGCDDNNTSNSDIDNFLNQMMLSNHHEI